MFTDWLLVLGYKQRKQILVGATVLCWSISKNRNDIIFDKSPLETYMQVLFRAMHLCHQWALLQTCEKNIKEMKNACGALETMVIQIFVDHGWWRFRNRVE
jgi:hypothetical protein